MTDHNPPSAPRAGWQLWTERRSRPANPARRFGDFTRWKEHDACQKALDQLLRDLRVETS